MLRIVLKREVLHNLYSLRFLVSLVLLIAVFTAGSLSFRSEFAADMRKYEQTQRLFQNEMKAHAGQSATALAVRQRTYTLRPRENAFIDDAKDKYLPNAVIFSAWNVFSFENRSGSANPFLNRFDELNWSFIAVVLLSFVALIFTFDAVSGEKETKTLALTLSNPVPRSTLLLGKYLSAVLSTLAILVVGILVSLIITVLGGRAPLGWALAGEVTGFVVMAGLMVATLAAFGLLCSIVSSTSNISLLLALAFWLGFAVVIPSSSTFLATRLFPVEASEAVQKKVSAASKDLYKNAPPGSTAAIFGNPFFPQHRLRADLYMKLMLSEKAIRDAHYRTIFRQLENTRLLTSVSPVALFQYLDEAIIGGGYVRFRKVWADFHAYQERFLEFFKSFDARDPKSPHWYNPTEDISTTSKPAPFDSVPQFSEQPMSFADRAAPALKYLLLGIFFPCAVFLLSYVLFARYDVR